MPFKIVGKTIMHKKGGKWSKKQTAKTEKNAESALRLLYAVDHGWKPTGGKRGVRKKRKNH